MMTMNFQNITAGRKVSVKQTGCKDVGRAYIKQGKTTFNSFENDAQ